MLLTSFICLQLDLIMWYRIYWFGFGAFYRESFIGNVLLLIFLYILDNIWSLYWLRQLKDNENYWNGYKGAFALITEGSGKLGFSFAKSLAKRGINIILVGRSKGNYIEI